MSLAGVDGLVYRSSGNQVLAFMGNADSNAEAGVRVVDFGSGEIQSCDLVATSTSAAICSPVSAGKHAAAKAVHLNLDLYPTSQSA